MKNRCLICGAMNTDRAHYKTRGSGAGWEDWEFTYLCRYHHIEQGQIGWYRFAYKYKIILRDMQKKGWKLTNEFGLVKLRRVKNDF